MVNTKRSVGIKVYIDIVKYMFGIHSLHVTSFATMPLFYAQRAFGLPC